MKNRIKINEKKFTKLNIGCGNKLENKFPFPWLNIDVSGKVADLICDVRELPTEEWTEKFEEVIFETAIKLVLTVDEKLTIEYPFLPRLNDVIYEDVKNKIGKSIIIDRLKNLGAEILRTDQQGDIALEY